MESQMNIKAILCIDDTELIPNHHYDQLSWWRDQIEAFTVLLAICVGIPFTKASDAELWCFLWSAPE